jgi:putative oxidoreductase
MATAKKKTKAATKAELSTCHNIMASMCCIYQWKVAFAEAYLNPVLQFLMRLVVAKVFFSSGILKLPAGFLGIGQGNWGTTLMLFEYEHPVPFLPVELAAFLGTATEIIAPVLLVIGLGSRVAAVALLIMTAVIEFTYQHSMDHVYWALLLGATLIQGPGKISLDYFLRKKFLACGSGCKA